MKKCFVLILLAFGTFFFTYKNLVKAQDKYLEINYKDSFFETRITKEKKAQLSKAINIVNSYINGTEKGFVVYGKNVNDFTFYIFNKNEGFTYDVFLRSGYTSGLFLNNAADFTYQQVTLNGVLEHENDFADFMSKASITSVSGGHHRKSIELCLEINPFITNYQIPLNLYHSIGEYNTYLWEDRFVYYSSFSIGIGVIDTNYFLPLKIDNTMINSNGIFKTYFEGMYQPIDFSIIDSEKVIINGQEYYKSKTIRIAFQEIDLEKYRYQYCEEGTGICTDLKNFIDGHIDIKFTYNTTLVAKIIDKTTKEEIAAANLVLANIVDNISDLDYETINLKGYSGIALYPKSKGVNVLYNVYLENADVEVAVYSKDEIVGYSHNVTTPFQIGASANKLHNFYMIKNNRIEENSYIKVPKENFEYTLIKDNLYSDVILNPNTGETETLPPLFELDKWYEENIQKPGEEANENWFVKWMKKLFVPTGKPFDDLTRKFNEKFGFVTQIKALFQDLINLDYSSEKPEFKMNLWGTEVNIVDFSAFEIVREVLHGMILALCWFGFVKRLYYKIPALIGGYGYLLNESNGTNNEKGSGKK